MASSIEIRVSRESANDDVVTIAEWHVKSGAKVKEMDILVSLDTSKAILEVEAEADGYIEIVVPAGKEVAVGSLIGYIHESAPADHQPKVDAPAIEQNSTAMVQTATNRYSKAAIALMTRNGITPEQFPGSGLVREADVKSFLNPQEKPDKQILPKPDTIVVEQTLVAEANEVQPEEPELSSDAPGRQTQTATQPVGGFFSDAKKSAGERGKGLVWLALNYFFRNYLLGHMAKMSPLGVNLVIHRWRGVKMGKGVYIDPSATVETAYPENITIGNDVRITANAIIMTHIKAPHELRNSGVMPLVKKPVVLEDHCFIGVGAVVMPGVTIGRGSVVTSGSVVLTNVPAGVMVTGNPAKVVKHLTTTQHGSNKP